jgi:hypothetical protein
VTRPGNRLRTFASRVCRPQVMERLIDPVIADLQCEYAAAQSRRQVWRGRRIRLAAYVAFWKVFGMHAAARAVPTVREWLVDDRAIGRALGSALLVTILVTALLMLPPFLGLINNAGNPRGHVPLTRSDLGWLILYLSPQGLAIGIAIGMPVGILLGMRGRLLSSRSRRAIAALAILSTLGASFTQNTLVPAGNQAFRQFIAHRLFARGVLARGPNELSISELSARIDAVKRAGPAADAGPLVRSLYMRLVVSIAPLVLGLFAIAACSAAVTGRESTLIGFAVTIAYISFYTVISPAAYWSATSRVQPFALAWLPNVLVVFLAHCLFRLAAPHEVRLTASATDTAVQRSFSGGGGRKHYR